MEKIVLFVFSLILLTACNSGESDAHSQHEPAAKTFVTTSYNYTPYGIYSINFRKSSVPFKIDQAASGGSIFKRSTTSQVLLDSGELVNFTSRNCCSIWNDPIEKSMQVRVVWSVVFDSAYYDGKSMVNYNERASRESAPGSRWCEAIVDIAPANNADQPDTVVFHFLNDGSVMGQLATFKTEAPLSTREIRKHMANLPPGKFCKTEIGNPYFGIPKAPHRE